MRCVRLAPVVLLVALAGGCEADGNQGGPDGDLDGGPTDGAVADAPLDASVHPPCTGCLPTEGCAHTTVMRGVDDNLPWKLFPAQADGIGTLVVSIFDGPTRLQRKEVKNTDFNAGASFVHVVFGCVPAKTLTVQTFFDDDLNAAPDDVTSSDAYDACDDTPSETQPVPVGPQPTDFFFTLRGGCG